MSITPAQLARLQTLCSQMARSVVGFNTGRDARLRWASDLLEHPVTTFSTLSMHEGRRLIDAAQGELGSRAPFRARVHSVGSEESRRRAGLDGRHDGGEFAGSPQLVSGDLLNEIESRYARLGWDRPQFDRWLAGRSSPLKGAKVIRTSAQANKVLWALKGILQDQGLWADWSAA